MQHMVINAVNFILGVVFLAVFIPKHGEGIANAGQAWFILFGCIGVIVGVFGMIKDYLRHR